MYEYSPLLQAIFDHAEHTPEKPAIIIGEERISYSALCRNISKAASILHRFGIGKGDKILLSARKEAGFIYLYFASHILGCVNVIIDAETNAERLHYIEKKIQPAYCFGYISDIFPSKQFTGLEIGNAPCYPESGNIPSLTKDNIAEILFTTGTTGSPKGVCLSYGNIHASASNINKYIGNTPEDVEVLGLPVCHSFGLGRIRCNLLKGATVVILGSFADVRRFFRAIEEYKATGFGVVPSAWAYIRKISGRRIQKYSRQIRYIEIGSAAMSRPVKEEMLEMFPDTRICMHYGLTEASRACFLEFHDRSHLDSIGLPVCADVEIRIFDGNGSPQPDGTAGEICVKGNMVMMRYLDENDNTDAFFGDYLRTGDNGYIANDRYVYLLGREKELINVGGKKVSPAEVEDAVCACGVGDCVCVPLKDEFGILGEQVKCYVLKGSTNLTFAEIAAAVSKRLEPYKRPVAYDWIDLIPLTASGKKQRLSLIEK